MTITGMTPEQEAEANMTVNWLDETSDLPLHLVQLRDGTAPPSPDAGRARARRIDKLQRQIAGCADFLADLERYTEHARKAPLVGHVLGPYMAAELEKLRQRMLAEGWRLQAELRQVRGG